MPCTIASAERSRSLSPDIDLDVHVDDVVQLLRFWDLRDVIVVGHSYGGMVITGVGDRAAARVGKLVYLDATNPRHGQSLVDVAGPVIEPRIRRGWTRASPATRGSASSRSSC